MGGLARAWAEACDEDRPLVANDESPSSSGSSIEQRRRRTWPPAVVVEQTRLGDVARQLVLLVARVLATYKPRGMTRYGWRKQYEARPATPAQSTVDPGGPLVTCRWMRKALRVRRVI
jgi:hypothetical protein